MTTYCSVCHLPQWESPSGLVCANGHGGAPSLDAPPQLICGFDTETHLIAAGDIIPRLVVATFDVAEEGRVSPTDNPKDTFKAWAVGNATDEPLHQLLEVFQEVYQRRMHLVIQAANFDLSVAMRYCLDVQAGLQFGDPAMAKKLYALIWETLERSMEDEWAGGRPLIHDTIIRDKLWHLSTHGSVDSWHGRDLRFSLSDLVERSFSVDISGFKVTTNASGQVFSHDGRDITGTAEAGAAWRLRYSELDRRHLSQWPPEALQYAIDDATWARKVWEVQEGRRRPRGHGSMNSASLQVYADLALRLYSATGFRLDQERVQRVKATIDAQLGKVREALRLNGIERPNGTVNTAVVKDRVENAWKVLGRPPMLTTKKGAISSGSEALEELQGIDPILDMYIERQEVIKIKTAFLPSIQGERVWSNYDILKETGRCSSYGSGDRAKKQPLFDAVNIQQMPRAAGVRECFLPPEGMLILSCDYSALELCSVAQVTYTILGFSVHRDKNLLGYDLHTYLAAGMASALAPYLVDESKNPDECYTALNKKRKAKLPDKVPGLAAEILLQWQYKEEATNWRNFAKPVGLGYPGGLGPKTLVVFAKGEYGVTMDQEQATTFRELWHLTYPEMKPYFKWVEAQNDPLNEDEYGGPAKCYETDGFNRFRAGATYCAAANGKAMQSLSADGAKRSACWVARACMGGLPPDSPYALLSDCVPLAFIHDENLVAVPDDLLATERALLTSRLMVEAMQLHMPDVKIQAEPALMRRWSKKAGDPEWVDEPGRAERVWAALESIRPGYADVVADAIGPNYNPNRRLVPWHDLHKDDAA